MLFIFVFAISHYAVNENIRNTDANMESCQEESLVEMQTQEMKEVIEKIGLDEMLEEFFQVVYTYDTQERNYYEGADAYMTQEAYEKICPLPDNNLQEESYEPVHMVSSLQDYQCYYAKSEDENTEIMADVWYTVTGTGGYQIEQIVVIKAAFDDGWKITDYEVIDTLEQ